MATDFNSPQHGEVIFARPANESSMENPRCCADFGERGEERKSEMSSASTGFVSGSERERQERYAAEGYNSRVATVGALSFDIVMGACVCVGLGYAVYDPTWFLYRGCSTNLYINVREGVGNTENACEDGAAPLPAGSTLATGAEFCNAWDAEATWVDIDALLGNTDSTDGSEPFFNVYTMVISAFASSLAAFIFLWNGCCCPLNGRYRAQIAAGFFYLAATALCVAALVLVSGTPQMDTGFWSRLEQALAPDAPPCEDGRYVLQMPVIILGVATILSFLNVFFALKVCCCGCCTVTVYEG